MDITGDRTEREYVPLLDVLFLHIFDEKKNRLGRAMDMLG